MHLQLIIVAALACVVALPDQLSVLQLRRMLTTVPVPQLQTLTVAMWTQVDQQHTRHVCCSIRGAYQRQQQQ